MFYPKKDYKLIGYQKSTTAFKKYDAILRNKITKKISYVPFGDSRYEQYEDKVPLKLYSSYDHKNATRRFAYRTRHAKDVRTGYYSPGYFSYYLLW